MKTKTNGKDDVLLASRNLVPQANQDREPETDSPRVARIKARMLHLLDRASKARTNMEELSYHAAIADVQMRIAKAQEWRERCTDPVQKAEAQCYYAEQTVVLANTRLARLRHLKAVEEVKREEQTER